MSHKEYTAEEVPFGYYRYCKNTDKGPIVHVLDRNGRKMVSFINKDLPIPINNVPSDVKFVRSKPDLNLEISPEEIEGREQELCAYLMEVLNENALNVTRGDKQLCVSRQDGTKRFFFNVDIQLDSIEINDEEEGYF